MYASKYLFFDKSRILLIFKGIEGKFIKTPSITEKQAQRSFHIDRSLGKINKIFKLKNKIEII